MHRYYMLFLVFFVSALRLSTAESASISASLYTPVIIGSKPTSLIETPIVSSSPYYNSPVTIYLSENLPPDLNGNDFDNGFNHGKRVRVYVRLGKTFKPVSIINRSGKSLSFHVWAKPVTHAGSVDIMVSVDGVDSPTYAIPVVAQPHKPPVIQKVQPKHFPFFKSPQSGEDTTFTVYATQMDASEFTRILVDGVSCVIGLIQRDEGFLIAYMPGKLLKKAGIHHVRLKNRAGMSKPFNIIVGQNNPLTKSTMPKITTSLSPGISKPGVHGKFASKHSPSTHSTTGKPVLPTPDLIVEGATATLNQTCNVKQVVRVKVRVKNIGSGPFPSLPGNFVLFADAGFGLVDTGVSLPAIAPGARMDRQLTLRSSASPAQLAGKTVPITIRLNKLHWTSEASFNNNTRSLSVTFPANYCKPVLRHAPPAVLQRTGPPRNRLGLPTR